MSVTVKHLNTDASFLLTFQPILPFPPSPGQNSSFTIVIDPWLSGSSNILHPLFSTTKNNIASCITSLTEIPEPNLIIISQGMSDHCHKATLTKLPKTGGNFTILAEKGAAKQIRSWKHFDGHQVITLKDWSKSAKGTSSPNIHRISLPSLTPRGNEGEVTISLIKEGDTAGLKNAVAVTYRAPTAGHLDEEPDNFDFSLTPPSSPYSLKSSRLPQCTKYLPQPLTRALSIIHAPHGISYPSLHPFITTHLLSTASLPLTALLHCFDRVQNPRWLGGNICSGAPSGMRICQETMARWWISAHDGDKTLKGVANKKLKVKKWEREAIEEVVSPRTPNSGMGGGRAGAGTEVIILGAGEERVFSSVGLWPGREEKWDDGVGDGDGDETLVGIDADSHAGDKLEGINPQFHAL